MKDTAQKITLLLAALALAAAQTPCFAEDSPTDTGGGYYLLEDEPDGAALAPATAKDDPRPPAGEEDSPTDVNAAFVVAEERGEAAAPEAHLKFSSFKDKKGRKIDSVYDAQGRLLLRRVNGIIVYWAESLKARKSAAKSGRRFLKDGDGKAPFRKAKSKAIGKAATRMLKSLGGFSKPGAFVSSSARQGAAAGAVAGRAVPME